MASIGNLVANLTMHTAGFVAGAKTAKSTMAGLTSSISTGIVGIRSALGPLTAALTGAFALGNAISGAREAGQASAKLAAVLESTGNAAGLTVDEITSLSSELQGLTNFEDDATTAAATILASFTNIRGDNFKEAIALAQDMATVMGTDLDTAVKKLGKQLNGLSVDEVGQKIDELQGRFGGAAAAVADPWTQLLNVFGDLSENIGALFLPLINSVSKQLIGQIGTINAWGTAFQEIGAAAAFVFENLGNYGYLAFLNIQLGLEQARSSFVNFFTGVLPTLLQWFGDNWRDVFFTAFDLATTVFINLGENIRNAMSAIWEFIASGGTAELKLAWKPLTEGFVNTISELPDLPERAVSELEKQLQGDVARIGGELGQGLGEAMAAATEPAKIKPNIGNIEESAGKKSDKVASAAVTAGSKDALSIIARASNDARSPLVRTAEKQLKEQQKTNTALASLPEKLGKSLNFQVADIA